MAKRVMAGDELIAALKMTEELLTFDEAMAALRRMGENSTNTIWPTLNGNECYAFANAAADAYREKMEAQNSHIEPTPHGAKVSAAGTTSAGLAGSAVMVTTEKRMAIVTTAEAETVMRRCLYGTQNCNEANNLHAECYDTIRALVQERDMLRTGDTCARHCEGTAYRIEARQQKHRADALAATIRELRDVVTHDAETKADFIERVRGILAADPDARVTPNASGKPTPLADGPA